MLDWKPWMGMSLLAVLVFSSAWAAPVLKSYHRQPELAMRSISDNSLGHCIGILRWELERLERVNSGYPDPALQYDSDINILWSDRPLLAPTRLQRLID
jgi:hypothetical protein